MKNLRGNKVEGNVEMGGKYNVKQKEVLDLCCVDQLLKKNNRQN